MIYEDYIRTLIARQKAEILIREAESIKDEGIRAASIRQAQATYERREREVMRLRDELRRSDEADDLIYFHIFIKKQRPETVGKLVGYSRSSVFRHIKKIRDNRRRIKEELS